MRTGQSHHFDLGPACLPDVLRQDMRGPDVADLASGLFEDMKSVLRCETGKVMFCPGSGPVAWEAALTNTLNRGDKVLIARHGQVSSRWVEMAQRLGLDVEVIDAAWGAGVPVEEIDARLGKDCRDEIKAVFVTHNDPATGVTSNVAELRRVLDGNFHDALLFVDGTSSIGALDFRTEAWEADLVVTGSEGLMLPSGLGILGVSEKALEASRTANMRRACFDFGDMLKMNADGLLPCAPPIHLLHGLRISLDRIAAEGLDNVIARHKHLAEGVRRGISAWGLSLVAEHHALYSNTVSAIRVPDDVDARDVLRIANDAYNTVFGSGQGPLAGKVFRIGHQGDLNEAMCLTALSIAEMSLYRAGAPLQLGAGVGAAQSWFAGAASGQPTFRIAAE